MVSGDVDGVWPAAVAFRSVRGSGPDARRCRAMSRVAAVAEDIRSAREYTCALLETVDPADWFRIPPAGVTHVAWQVGHLAVAQYHLGLSRVRGARPEDEALISSDMLKRFGKGSVPEPDAAKNLPLDEIRAAFDRVHERVLQELAHLPDEALDEEVSKPHPRFNTKGGALAWAARHEMLHAGQIGLLRRQLGAEPLR